MKKNKKLILILLMVFLLTGCSKRLVDPKTKKPVTNPETTQVLIKNIYCRPKDSKTIKIYEKYSKEVDLKKLDECENLKLTGKYEGLFESFITRPIAWLITRMNKIVNNYGVSFIIIAILIRLILLPLGLKAKAENEKIQKMQPELQKLNKKYEGKDDKDSMLKRAMEQQMLMKKYDIKMGTSLITSFIQLPILFGLLGAINRIPTIFEDNFLTMSLGMTPIIGITKEGNMMYLLIVIINALVTFYSFKQMQKTQMTQENPMMNIMMIFISFMALIMQSALVIYWITTTLFGIIQNSDILFKEEKA